MKKKLILIISVIMIASVLCAAFSGCKSAEEKEKDYYANVGEDLTKCTDKLQSLTDDVFNKSWKSTFILAMTYYMAEVEVEKIGDDGKPVKVKEKVPNPIVRGSKNKKGWPKDADQYVTFMEFSVSYKNKDNYTVKTTVFKDVERSYYVNNIGSKKYKTKFTVEKELEYKMENAVESGELNDGINPIELIAYSTDKEDLKSTGISASDNFRIYTHFMRIESRIVFDSEGNSVTRQINDDNAKKYWKGYGEDISYNWDNVYGMTNNRLTVLYSKGKNRINQLEIYNENILAYYTEKDKVDTSLVLKADVVGFSEMVVKFEY